MDKNSVRNAVLCFEIAVIKELYKNNKIGENEYLTTLKKLETEQEKIIIEDNLMSAVLDIKV